MHVIIKTKVRAVAAATPTRSFAVMIASFFATSFILRGLFNL
jgi:hypothetical protein